MNNYYVYVYIDPRNLEEFYYGKGKGSRKDAHLVDTSRTAKSARITAIHDAGLKPIVRVIARDLTEHDALLVEKTLLWKLGRQLTNVAGGHYTKSFRPHNTIDHELSGFDYRPGVYYYNVGDGPHRNWDDYRRYGFISAGGREAAWRDAMLAFREGDIVAAYLKGKGFVGIGRVVERAKPIRHVIVRGRPLLNHPLACPKMDRNVESDTLCEYVALVKWIKSVRRDDAKWKPHAGLYTTTHIRASLDRQQETKWFLERAFGVEFSKLVP